MPKFEPFALVRDFGKPRRRRERAMRRDLLRQLEGVLHQIRPGTSQAGVLGMAINVLRDVRRSSWRDGLAKQVIFTDVVRELYEAQIIRSG